MTTHHSGRTGVAPEDPLYAAVQRAHAALHYVDALLLVLHHDNPAAPPPVDTLPKRGRSNWRGGSGDSVRNGDDGTRAAGDL